jgi:chromosome segregation ATPase
MLHAAEDTCRSELEERNQLEAWVRDIEKRIGQREEEHAAELDTLKNRLVEASKNQDRLQKQLRRVAASGGARVDAEANKQDDEILESLQSKNRQLEENLAELQKKCLTLENRLESIDGGEDESLRAERAKLAQEQAKISRMRYELSSKLAEIEQVPKTKNEADQETGQRIRALREHLREIHEQEKQEFKEPTLATRLSGLWKRVEY